MVDAEIGELHRRRGVPLMDPELAVAALGQALADDETQLVVADIVWETFAPALSFARPRPLLREVPEAVRALADETSEAAVEATADYAQQLVGLSEAEQLRVLAELVHAETALVLGHAKPDAVRGGKAFKEMGFDSLTGVELRNRLNAATGCALPATVVFDHPTPRELAAHLREKLVAGFAPAHSGDLLDELDRLEKALVDSSPGGQLREQIGDRLRALAWKWGSAAAENGDPDELDDEVALDSVSDDEMFDLIDKELGLGLD